MKINVNYHSSIQIGDIYIDPFKIIKNINNASYIFITHSHYDHYSKEDINKVINDKTIVVCSKDVYEDFKNYYKNKVIVAEPNKKYNINGLTFETFPSYNISKKFHPKSNNWVGYIISVNNEKYCIIGDSDLTDEVKGVKCDVLFVPIGGTYTMNAIEASKLANIIKPNLVVPVHYNGIIGNKEDEKVFISNLNNIKYQLFL